MTDLFKEYINTEFKDAVVEFNHATGLDSDDFTLEHKVNNINLQANIVREELIETITAWGDDEIETLDGLADMWYTLVNLNEKLSLLADPESESYAEKHVNIKKLEMLSSLCEVVLHDLPSGFTDEQKLAACKLVVDNNKGKYTTDKTEFDTWQYDKKLKPKETLWNGVTYYCLVGRNGKVGKHKHFAKVCLKDVISLNDKIEVDEVEQ